MHAAREMKWDKQLPRKCRAFDEHESNEVALFRLKVSTFVRRRMYVYRLVQKKGLFC